MLKATTLPLNNQALLVYLYVNSHKRAPMSPDNRACVSIDYLEPILKHCNNCGIPTEEVVAGTSLVDQQPKSDFITLAESEQLLDNLRDRLPITPYQLGLLIGISLSASSHGQLGFVGMCSQNFDEALRLTKRFIPLVTPMFDLSYGVEEDLAIIGIEETLPIPRRSYSFMMGLLLGGIRAMSLALLGTRLFNYLDRSTIQLTIEASEVDPAWREAMAPLKFQYGADKNKISFAKELVFVDLPLANKASLASALAVCEERIAKLQKLQEQDDKPVCAKIIGFLESTTRPYPNLEDVADHFCVSPRTLHRQLQKI